MKKIISIFLCAMLLGTTVLAGCNSGGESTDTSQSGESGSATDTKLSASDPIEGIKATASSDKYRNFYEIFVNSFADSDEDDTGDLQGIISQLDYLNDGDPDTGDDLGIDGIWLTPIMPSKSYHKYDVEDYYDIDPDFGTMDDFEQLVEECHKRGIKLILDLVLNHISSQNPLFKQAVEDVAEGKLDGAAQYFEIRKGSEFDYDTNVIELTDGYVCEANFSQEMPEWNLSSDKTREEFTKIAKFWLDKGVDGFRLDACKYYTNKFYDGTEFLKWFYETCQDINPDVYMVGEDWTDDTDIQELFNSGIDSLFAFKFATNSGLVVSNIQTQQGSGLVKKAINYDEKMKKSNPKAINTLFLSNHDQMRIANTLEPRGLEWEKFAASVYMLFNGNPFIYYGEEIGIKAPNSTNDAAYRTPMVFDSDNMPTIFVNSIGDEFEEPTFGGVKQQLADKNSLLNFYRRVIKVKNQNPEIARGTVTQYDFKDDNIGAFFSEYEGSKVLVIHNFNFEESKELEITDTILPNAMLRADLITSDADSHTELKDGKIIIPPLSSVVLKAS